MILQSRQIFHKTRFANRGALNSANTQLSLLLRARNTGWRDSGPSTSSSGLASRTSHRPRPSSGARPKRDAELRILARARGLVLAAFDDRRRRICGERNHERFNCEPLASSAHSRRQWSQQVQRLSAVLGQALAGLDCRSLQRGQRGVLEQRERAGISIVTRTDVNGDQLAFETHE